MNSSETVYRRFVEVEKRAAAIYLQFASYFSQDSQLSSFWRDMATHEEQHAQLLQFCLGEGLFVSEPPDNAEIERLIELVKRLEQRAADPKIAVADAFSLALEMEKSEIGRASCRERV